MTVVLNIPNPNTPKENSTMTSKTKPQPIDDDAAAMADELIEQARAASMAPEGLPHYDADELQAAVGTLSAYGTYTDTGFRPTLALPISALVDSFVTAYETTNRKRIRREMAARLLAQSLGELTRSAESRVQRVNTSPQPDVTTDPLACHLVFVALPEGSRLAIEHGCVGGVVAYYPTTYVADDGSERTSLYNDAGIGGFVRMFHTWNDLIDAADEAANAVRTVRSIARRAERAARMADDPFSESDARFGGVPVI